MSWWNPLDWFKGEPNPTKLASGKSVTGDTPLWDQFQRIGGGITPQTVSIIMREADSGQPARFVDLFNESRQKDGHLQSVLFDREVAPALTDLGFVEPSDATPEEKKAADTCRRIRDEFRNWSDLIAHLNGCSFGHGTGELRWDKRPDGFVLPREAKLLHAREFIFSADSGALRYRTHKSDRVGVDILADNPGRIIQVQRRVVGDIAAREGLARILTWSALLRNWSLRDWVLLGEIGWKPWRKGKYPAGWDDDEINKLMRVLEKAAAMGLIVHPDDVEVDVEWPKGQSSSQGTSPHHDLFDTLGREMSKAVVGQTTTIESGPHGTRGDAQVRAGVRSDIRELDCRVIAGPLMWHMFEPAVQLNHGPSVRCPVPWFQTEEAANQLEFSQAIGELVKAGLRVPAKYVRDEFGMPEPLKGEELLEPIDVEVPDGDPEEEPEEPAKAA